ncbi:tetratricopeptide repeat protein [Planctomycetaceae bacterium SH139]
MQYLNPLSWARWAFQFFFAWLSSIQWRGALMALPATIVLLMMVAGSAIVASQSNDWRDSLVDRRLRKAAKQENYEVAELLLRRRIKAAPEDPKLKLQLARVRDQRGDTERATDLFRSLAFEQKNAEAATWLLRNRFELDQRQDWSAEQNQEFGQLTEIALASDPNDAVSNTLRADYLLRKGDIRGAIPHIEKLVSRQPTRGLDLAQLYQAVGDDTSAMTTAQRTEKVLKDLVAANPAEVSLRAAHAKALVFLKQYPDAYRTLAAGFEKSQDNRLRPLIAQTLVMYSDSLRANSTDAKTLQNCLKLIGKASEYAPADPLVMRAISDTIIATLNQDDAQTTALRNALLEGAAPGIVHFIKGTVAMLEEDTELAKRELELAYRQMPQSAAILNNLAVAKTNLAKESNDAAALADALKLVNQAIESTAGKPQASKQLAYFIETRAQVYLAQQNYVDAISDFEKILTVEPLKLSVHRGLADAYRALKQPDVAELHARAAENIVSQRAKQAADKRDAMEVYGESLRNESSGTESATSDAPVETLQLDPAATTDPPASAEPGGGTDSSDQSDSVR